MALAIALKQRGEKEGAELQVLPLTQQAAKCAEHGIQLTEAAFL